MASGIINTVGLRPQIVHSARGTSGQAGFIRICRITVLQTYANAPIRLTISQRARPDAEISIVFENVNSTDPAVLYFIYDCPREDLVNLAFLYKATTSTWDLYIQKLDNYDHIDVVSADIPFYEQGKSMSVTWTDDQQNSALSWTYTAQKPVSHMAKTINFIGWHNLLPMRADRTSFYFHVNGLHIAPVADVNILRSASLTVTSMIKISGTNTHTGAINVRDVRQRWDGLEIMASIASSVTGYGLAILDGTLTVN